MRNDVCFLCGKQKKNLENHHLVPKFMTKYFPELKGKGGTIGLCTECHEKVHYLLEPINLALKYEVRLDEAPSSKKLEKDS